MPADIRVDDISQSVQTPRQSALPAARQVSPPSSSVSGRLRRLKQLAASSARDVAILVTGILLAFALDAWWDDQQDIRRETEILRALSREFRDLQAELDRQAELREHLLHTNLSTLLLLQREQFGRSIVIPDTIAQWLAISLTLDLPQSSLQGVISSGRIDLIRDRELRSMLAAWPALVRDAQEELAQDRLIVYERLIPLLTDDLSRLIVTSYDSVNVRARRGSLPSISLTADPQTMNILASRIRLAQLAAVDAGRLAAQLERIEQRIAAALR